MKKIYPDSGVELKPFIARFYDSIMNFASLGFYRAFIKKAIKDIGIQPGDTILDLGCGTGGNTLLMSEYLNDSGSITGMDVSPVMKQQFEKKFANEEKINFLWQRIDLPFDLGKQFDIVFISFVIHGFPHEVRQTVIKNAFNHLKFGGNFVILDFAQFDMDKMPWLYRSVFKTIECKYAFDFIKRDWKEILRNHGFQSFHEYFYVKNYVRLLKAQKHTSMQSKN
jgi:ubiquinone/menaquinone biosynthesis C-methylase UbiE